MSEDDTPAHAENSPSSSEGWSTCADYINANRGLEDRQSWEAAEGTAAHWIRNECLTNGVDADGYIGHVQKVGDWTFEWTEDDAMLLQPGIDRLREIPGQFFGEQRVDLTEWLGRDTQGREQGGTLDAMIVNDDFYVIDDLKWGRGVPVWPRENKQLMLYALGAWQNIGRHHSKATKFLLSIDQPRHAGGGGTWWTTLDDLLRFGDWIRERAEATRAPNPPRTASAAGCMWCRRKLAPGGCATFETFALELMSMGLDDLDNGTILMPEGLTPERRSVLLGHKTMIEKWLEQLEEATLCDALAGLSVPCFKAVEGRKSPDKWNDKAAAEAAVTAVLRENAFTKKLITPTQCAKQIPADSFDRLLIDPCIEQGKRKPVLVPVEDERLAIRPLSELDNL